MILHAITPMALLWWITGVSKIYHLFCSLIRYLGRNSTVTSLMRAMASQITSVLIVCPTVCSGADQRIHQSSASLAFVRGSYQSPVNSPHKGPVTLKMLTFDDVIMNVVHANDSERGRVIMAMAYGVSSTWPVAVITHGFNTLKPKQNGRQFPADIFKCIFVNENMKINKILQFWFR